MWSLCSAIFCPAGLFNSVSNGRQVNIYVYTLKPELHYPEVMSCNVNELHTTHQTKKEGRDATLVSHWCVCISL